LGIYVLFSTRRQRCLTVPYPIDRALLVLNVVPSLPAEKVVLDRGNAFE
jgi:hypothetical protein